MVGAASNTPSVGHARCKRSGRGFIAVPHAGRGAQPRQVLVQRQGGRSGEGGAHAHVHDEGLDSGCGEEMAGHVQTMWSLRRGTTGAGQG